MICAVISKPSRAAAVTIAAASALLALTGWIWYTWDRTIYADGFSQKEFDQVVRGMPEAEVVSRLGQPLIVNEGVRPETWFYGEAEIESHGVSSVFDLFGPTQAVTFDETSLVAKVSGDLLQAVSVGMKKAEVLEAAGPPKRKIPRMVRVFHYSRPSGSGLFRARIIGLGEDRSVVAVFAYEFHD
jgi:outer membrane protein assembly factor BamE (lipoprotein component of BamABCDE complex)